MGAGLVDIIAKYTNTFLWLQQYDDNICIFEKIKKIIQISPAIFIFDNELSSSDQISGI
jgi:hypothetical protein